MTLSQGEWSKKTVNNKLVFECDVTATTSEHDIYTLKTLKELDGSRPWILMVNTAAADISDNTDAVDIWAGFADNFALTGDDGTVAATNGSEVASAVMDDVSDAVLVTTVNPNRTAAKVQGVAATAGEVNAGVAPYYAINIDSDGTVKGATTHFVIIQDRVRS